MKQFYKLVSQALIVCMVWTPFSLQAGMIGTDQVVAGVQSQVNRDRVLEFVARGDVTRQLESLGLSSSTAKERVNAMTQEEISSIAGQIDSLPAGAANGWAIAAVILVVIAIWWYVFRK